MKLCAPRIPKIIHYCWLSDDPIPEKLQQCMNSWKEKLCGYEFILWNFDRFDINSSLWVKQAFEAKKYAFAADFIRLYAVYHHGGIYLDMDIEVVKSFDDLLNNNIMIGYENNETKDIEAGCFGAEKNSPTLKECLSYYNNRNFIKQDGEYDTLPLPQIMKKILGKTDAGILFYSEDYFTAKSYTTGIVTVTGNTYAIHHFAGSWLQPPERFYLKARNVSIKLFGYKMGNFIVIPILIIKIFLINGFAGIKEVIFKKFGKK